MTPDKRAAEPRKTELEGSVHPRPESKDRPLVARGVVKWFNQVSDYGYIACDQGGPDRYVRGESIIGASSLLPAGSQVEFEPRDGGMGPEAINVRGRVASTDAKVRLREAKGLTAVAVSDWEGEGGRAAREG